MPYGYFTLETMKRLHYCPNSLFFPATEICIKLRFIEITYSGSHRLRNKIIEFGTRFIRTTIHLTTFGNSRLIGNQRFIFSNEILSVRIGKRTIQEGKIIRFKLID